MENELLFARQVMQSLLPDRPAVGAAVTNSGPTTSRPVTSGATTTASYRCRRSTWPIAAARPCWAIAVGDVVGKGMPAALLTVKLSTEVRMHLRGNPEPSRVVELLNHQFDSGGVLDLYITFLLAILDVERHHLQNRQRRPPLPLDPPAAMGGSRKSGGANRDCRWGSWASARYEVTETTLEPGEDGHSVHRRRDRRDERGRAIGSATKRFDGRGLQRRAGRRGCRRHGGQGRAAAHRRSSPVRRHHAGLPGSEVSEKPSAVDRHAVSRSFRRPLWRTSTLRQIA